jgi:hypothetical protein
MVYQNNNGKPFLVLREYRENGILKWLIFFLNTARPLHISPFQRDSTKISLWKSNVEKLINF